VRIVLYTIPPCPPAKNLPPPRPPTPCCGLPSWRQIFKSMGTPRLSSPSSARSPSSPEPTERSPSSFSPAATSCRRAHGHHSLHDPAMSIREKPPSSQQPPPQSAPAPPPSPCVLGAGARASSSTQSCHVRPQRICRRCGLQRPAVGCHRWGTFSNPHRACWLLLPWPAPAPPLRQSHHRGLPLP